VPVYASWSEDGAWVARLVQRGSVLELDVLDADTLEPVAAIARTSPLFFTWAGNRIAAFLGGDASELPSLSVFSPGTDEVVRLPSRPCNFCAPVWRPPHVYYVAGRGGVPTLMRADTGSGVASSFEHLDGLVAVTLSPDGTQLARAVAEGGNGSPYTDLALIDPDTGESVKIREEPCLAYLWAPDSRHLAIAAVDTGANVLRWSLLDSHTGTERDLCALRPTREMAFYLRFFEQYHHTHPIVSPDGADLVLGGELGEGPVMGVKPHVWRVPLDGSEPESLGDGVFGVFAPAPRDTQDGAREA
jgi:hypothetical protein